MINMRVNLMFVIPFIITVRFYRISVRIKTQNKTDEQGVFITIL